MPNPTQQERTAGRRVADLPAVAGYLQTSVRHLRRLVSERRIPHHKVGNLIRFDLDEIDAWFDTTHRGPDGGRSPA
jgi:excisionase family DNA binding protein